MQPPPRIRVRWLMFGCVFAAAFVTYVQRQSLSVVATRLMPEAG